MSHPGSDSLLTPHRYAECFAAFFRRSSEYVAMRRFLAETIGSRCAEGFRMLDIGAGTGEFILSVLPALDKQPGHYTALEPNPDLQRLLRAALTRFPCPTELRPVALTSQTVLPPEWDFILMSHCLYYMRPVVDHVRAALHGLRPGGTLLIFHQTHAGAAAFYRFFEPRLARSESLPFDYSSTTSDVAEALRQAGLSPEVRQFPSTLETTDFMQEDTRELDEVLSFFMHTEVSALPSALRQEMREYLRLASLPCNGRWFLSLPVGALLLRDLPAR